MRYTEVNSTDDLARRYATREPTGGATRLLRAREVAEILQVPVAAVYRLHREGELQAVRIGRACRWAPSVVDAYIAGQGHRLAGGWKREP